MASISKKIKRFNTGRNPQILPLKYQAMRHDVFTFYRGSCHLFYAEIGKHSVLQKSPVTWLCGDLHLANFGCYQAENKILYFNANDFDEAVLAPCLYDVARLLVSILLATEILAINSAQALSLCDDFLQVYAQTLHTANAQWLDTHHASGEIKDFLYQAAQQTRKDFLSTRTTKQNNQLTLAIDNKHTAKLNPSLKNAITQTINNWATHQPQPDFYRVLDVGYKIAGTGSLGLERYIALMAGTGKKGRRLLDMKMANPSCVTAFLNTAQPAWKNEAVRITQLQRRLQIHPPALLNVLKFEQRWFVLKELQPAQETFDFSEYAGKLPELRRIICCFAQITAWNQLRSSGQDNAATADKLIAFAKELKNWKTPLLNETLQYAARLQQHYARYCDAYDKGYFKQ